MTKTFSKVFSLLTDRKSTRLNSSHLSQLGEPLVRGSCKSGLSLVGKEVVAFSLCVEVIGGDVEKRP